LMPAKRAAFPLFADPVSLAGTDALPLPCRDITSLSSHTLDTGPDVLRSVVLLI
jgi:hypothetical protein